jgi:hypothetical protein
MLSVDGNVFPAIAKGSIPPNLTVATSANAATLT